MIRMLLLMVAQLVTRRERQFPTQSGSVRGLLPQYDVELRRFVGTFAVVSAIFAIGIRPLVAQTLLEDEQATVHRMPTAVAPAAPVEGDRFTEFLDDSLRSRLFYARVLGTALLDQIGDSPEEWTGATGYGQRNLARFGKQLTSETISHSVAAALNHQVHYDRCSCEGFWPRVRHALFRVVTTRREDGHIVMNVARVSASYGSAGIANAWYPASYTKKKVLSGGTMSLVTSAGFNIVREFIK